MTPVSDFIFTNIKFRSFLMCTKKVIGEEATKNHVVNNFLGFMYSITLTHLIQSAEWENGPSAESVRQ